jgi:hypothetical protein
MSYEAAKLRRFIQEYFSSDELDTLLFDYFPTVREEFTPGMVKSRQVKLLLDYCQRHGRMPDLLAAMLASGTLNVRQVIKRFKAADVWLQRTAGIVFILIGVNKIVLHWFV